MSVPYGRAHLLFDEEQKHQQAILQYKGYFALSDAFKCFFLETVELFNTLCRPKVTTPLSEFYGIFVPRLAHGFRSLCGAERVAIYGYPYHAYTLLRNTFDNLVLTSAALQKVTDFYSIEGVTPSKPFDIDAVKKLRKDTEFEVRRKMTGTDSGLTQETRDELAKWDALFDVEVHGARLSLAGAEGWMKGQAPGFAAVRGNTVHHVSQSLLRSGLDGAQANASNSAAWCTTPFSLNGEVART